jgi:hypothetical protein
VDCELLARRHIVTSQVEHSSVLNYCMALSSGGGIYPDQIGTSLFVAAGVARASRPLWRGHPARAWRERDAPETVSGTPALQEPGYRVTYLPVDCDGLPHFCWFY